MDFKHTSVLLQEAVDGLNIKADKKYIDATAGGGGHTEEILKRGGIVLALDQDPDAIEVLEKRFEHEKEVTVAEGNFGKLDAVAKSNGFDKVAGVLFDLGLSSYQIDISGRGFSFRREEELDMRMDKKGEMTAFEIVNKWSGEALIDLFSKVGEEHYSVKIVERILKERAEGEIRTASQLSKIIERAVPVRGGPIHPATRVFQALRIAVNNELENLKEGIRQAFELLEKGGRISVISFHSLEDRIAKLAFLEFERKGLGRIYSKKPITPSIEEVGKNRRSRSAKLRIIEKI